MGTSDDFIPPTAFDHSPEKMMTVEELADVLQLSSKTIYRLLKRGEIPAHRIGHKWRFDRRDIRRWLFERRVQKLRDSA